MLSVSLQSHKVPKHSWPEGPRQPAETQAMCAAMDEGNLERIAFSRHTRAGNLDRYLAEQMRLCSGSLHTTNLLVADLGATPRYQALSSLS